MFKSRIPEAITELEAEITIDPGYAASYYTLADAYTRVGRYDDAERLLQRSIWLDSSASGPYVLMAKVLLRKHESVLAVRSAQQALRMDPNNSMAHYLLGQAYRDMGKGDDAEREMKIAQQLQSAHDSKAELQNP
jgi:pentatricopeptide repeat protein